MTALQGAMESTAPVSRLHLRQSFELADFPAPARREEEWRFTPLRSSAMGTTSGQRRLGSAPPARRLTLCMGSWRFLHRAAASGLRWLMRQFPCRQSELCLSGQIG
jgi:hypothetical protein